MTQTCRPFYTKHLVRAIMATALLTGINTASAGLFDDDEARRQVTDLSIQTSVRMDTVAKAQIELANQIQALREENARLRGQVETLSYELESTKKRQQDFYVDLDSRLRKMESPSTPGAETGDSTGPVDANGNQPIATGGPSPANENKEYEAALDLFRANQLSEAANALSHFVKTRPDSSLAPSAQYWLGNAYYAMHDCKHAIDAQRVVVAKWPQHDKAPEALLNVATCQQELGDNQGAKTTLNAVIIKYPASPATSVAKQRLKK